MPDLFRHPSFSKRRHRLRHDGPRNKSGVTDGTVPHFFATAATWGAGVVPSRPIVFSA
jgi:hypothetical protein